MVKMSERRIIVSSDRHGTPRAIVRGPKTDEFIGYQTNVSVPLTSPDFAAVEFFGPKDFVLFGIFIHHIAVGVRII